MKKQLSFQNINNFSRGKKIKNLVLKIRILNYIISEKKFIVLVNQPLNKSNLLRFEVNTKYQKIDKIFWCLLPLHNKKIFSKYNTKDFRSVKSKNFKIFNSYFELFKEILKLKITFTT